jgi:spore coat polysaccharide biosynthesis predicted glycosyltransferase SpsG
VSYPRIQWIETTKGLADELSRADVAVLAGGVSLYEACALGVPSVAVPVVKAQEPTVTAFARRRAVVGCAPVDTPSRAIAIETARLLCNRGRKAQMAGTSRALVDGRGAVRVAAAIHSLCRQSKRY